jgi:hypothetical protein
MWGENSKEDWKVWSISRVYNLPGLLIRKEFKGKYICAVLDLITMVLLFTIKITIHDFGLVHLDMERCHKLPGNIEIKQLMR